MIFRPIQVTQNNWNVINLDRNLDDHRNLDFDHNYDLNQSIFQTIGSAIKHRNE